MFLHDLSVIWKWDPPIMLNARETHFVCGVLWMGRYKWETYIDIDFVCLTSHSLTTNISMKPLHVTFYTRKFLKKRFWTYKNIQTLTCRCGYVTALKTPLPLFVLTTILIHYSFPVSHHFHFLEIAFIDMQSLLDNAKITFAPSLIFGCLIFWTYKIQFIWISPIKGGILEPLPTVQ